MISIPCGEGSYIEIFPGIIKIHTGVDLIIQINLEPEECVQVAEELTKYKDIPNEQR